MTRAEIVERLTTVEPHLRRRYGVIGMGIFGSFAHGGARADSDVDLLVDFERPLGLFQLSRLEAELSRLLGRRVDLVPRDSLNPRYAPYILPSVVPVR